MQQRANLSQYGDVSQVCLTSEPAEEIDQHTGEQGCHYPFHKEGQNEAIRLLQIEGRLSCFNALTNMHMTQAPDW